MVDNLPTQIFEDKTRRQVDGSLPDDEKIEGFVASQVIQRGLDKRTANAYRFDLQQIYLWLGEQRIPILEESAAEDYLEYLIKEKKRKTLYSYKKIQGFAVLFGISVQARLPGKLSQDYPSCGENTEYKRCTYFV